MARIRVTENELLAAVRATKPVAPGPPWMTRQEVQAALNLSLTQTYSRLQMLVAAGKAEKMRGPRRGDNCGRTWYYRLKNGKTK